MYEDFIDPNIIKSDEKDTNYLYELKPSLLTETEKTYLYAIVPLLPQGYIMQPQVNLASIIQRTDKCKFCNELFRNVDACIFDGYYKPIALIEINDSSHDASSRKVRDKRVKDICEEAGIPIIKFWTKYGVNTEYMSKKVAEAIELSKNPVRVKHSADNQVDKMFEDAKSDSSQETIFDYTERVGPEVLHNVKRFRGGGCYVATCVYGSYDCPQVWTLRRFRDFVLAKSLLGRAFIKTYYAISPKLVKWFGNTKVFKAFWKGILDKMVVRLNKKGMSDEKYYDYYML